MPQFEIKAKSIVEITIVLEAANMQWAIQSAMDSIRQQSEVNKTDLYFDEVNARRVDK